MLAQHLGMHRHAALGAIFKRTETLLHTHDSTRSVECSTPKVVDLDNLKVDEMPVRPVRRLTHRRQNSFRKDERGAVREALEVGAELEPLLAHSAATALPDDVVPTGSPGGAKQRVSKARGI